MTTMAGGGASRSRAVRARARSGGASLRELLHRLDRRELETVEAQIADYLQPEPPALVRYRRAYERSLPARCRPVTWREVVEAARRAEVVLVGDYHTLPEAQRAALDLALELGRTRHLVLGLEMVASRHQTVLDAWSEGRLGDLDLQAAIDYPRSWPFPWAHYRPLLDIARRRGWPLLALDSSASIRRRDRHAARRLAGALAMRPAALHLVLVGDLHLAPDHLPASIAAARPGTRMVVVHQNEPRIHADLVARGLELETRAVLLGPGRYCLLNATPLRRERSYLAWIESRWGQAQSGPADPAGELAAAIVRLADLLGLEPPDGEREVRTGASLDFLDELARRGVDRARLAFLRREISDRGRCLVPELGLVYVRQPRSDDLAELAMQILQEACGEPPLDEPPPGGPEAEAALLAAVRREALAYVGACLVHPLRVADAAQRDAPRRAPRRRRIDAAGELLAALEARVIRRRPFRVGRRLRGLDPAARRSVARQAGAELGRRLFLGLVGERIERPTLCRLLAPPRSVDRRRRERTALLELARLAAEAAAASRR
ncbi:MAG: ChaN family lipoprotein [Candidatus Eiseniibacteriota bacterium]|jgi:hypothetical protein